MKRSAKYHRLTLLALLFVLGVTATGIAMAQESDDRVTVTLWHRWDAGREEWIQHMLDEFMEAHPDIKAEQVLTPGSGMADRLTLMLSTGTAPEIVMINSGWAAPLMAMGGLMVLDDKAERADIDLSLFHQADLASFQMDQRTYALPHMSGTAWTNLLFTNRRLLQEAGLDPDAPPSTWAELREAATRLTRTDGEGRLVQSGVDIPQVIDAAHWNGAQLWSEDWRTANVVDERVLETVDFIQDLLEVQYGNWANYAAFLGTGYDIAFYQERQGLSFRNNSAFGHLMNLGFVEDWGAGLAPASGLHEDAQPIGLTTSTWAYGVPANLPPEKLDATLKLLRWVTAYEDGAGWFSRYQGRPSPVVPFNQHSDYRENPYWNVVMEAANLTQSTPPISFATANSELMAVVRSEVNPQQGMAAAELQLQLRFDEYWEIRDR